MKEIKLKVAEAYLSDVGLGIVRIDEKARKKLNVNLNEFVLIRVP